MKNIICTIEDKYQKEKSQANKYISQAKETQYLHKWNLQRTMKQKKYFKFKTENN